MNQLTQSTGRWAGHTKKIITKVCEVCGIEFRSTASREKSCPARTCGIECYSSIRKVPSGEQHHNWRGGKRHSVDGYVTIYLGRRKQAFEHTLVMEKHLGRKLLPHEVIHHKNEIKNDNRLENLQLTTVREHRKLHRKKI